MAVAAETSRWYRVDQAYAEQDRAATIEQQRYIGSMAIEACVSPLEQPNQTTLLADVQLAKLGDENAQKRVRLAVQTDLAERLYKVGHSKVELEFVDGYLEQAGRKIQDVNANTLRYSNLNPEMYQRFSHDHKHALVLQRLRPTGILDTHNAIVFSTTPTKMSEAEKIKYGMFVDTESVSIQSFATSGDAVLLETAFVAGKPTPNSQRQDLAVIRRMTAGAGVELQSDDGTEMLQYMLLVPKAEMPNGVVDIVKQYDQAAGGTFFGQASKRSDYAAFIEECDQRTAAFEDVLQQINDQLLAEAHLFTTPLEVVERLDHLSGRLSVKYAASRSDVDTLVFGRSAAMHLAEYRFFMEHGQTDRADASLRKAQEVQTSGSCPLYKPDNAQTDPDKPSSTESSGKKNMKCPFCKAKVFGDPCAAILSCWDCRALVIHGKLESKGDGGSAARAAKKAERAERQRTRVGRVGRRMLSLATV